MALQTYAYEFDPDGMAGGTIVFDFEGRSAAAYGCVPLAADACVNPSPVKFTTRNTSSEKGGHARYVRIKEGEGIFKALPVCTQAVWQAACRVIDGDAISIRVGERIDFTAFDV